MAFVTLCKQNSLYEGEVVPFTLDGQEVLLVWPDGGKPKAYHGQCPHQQVSLANARFNGKQLTCPAHAWVFDGHSGQGLQPKGCALKEFALQIVAGQVQVDLDSIVA